MKRILVPTDFSKHAEEALKSAVQIAKKNGSEIFLLHLLELPHQLHDAMTNGSSIPEVMLFIKKAKICTKKQCNKLKRMKQKHCIKGFYGRSDFSTPQTHPSSQR